MKFESTDASEAADYTEMMDERFTIYSFTKPIPKRERRSDHPQCGACCARFHLETHQEPIMTQFDDMSTQRPPMLPTQLDGMATQSCSSSAGDRLIAQLQEVELMKQSGSLSLDEAVQARRLLLGFAASGA